MPLPFEPESIESMRERYPLAIERIWQLHEINSGDRPGLKRTHVFDFDTGLRLLISRSQFTSHDFDVHISASWEHDRPLNIKTIKELTKQLEDAFHMIGGKGNLHFLGMSANFIPHWLVK